MAALGSPARTLRGLLRELRYLSEATGRPYRDTAAYRYLVKAFRAHRVRKPEPALQRPFPGEGATGWAVAGRGAAGRGARLAGTWPPPQQSRALGRGLWPEPRG